MESVQQVRLLNTIVAMRNQLTEHRRTITELKYLIQDSSIDRALKSELLSIISKDEKKRLECN